MGEEYCRPDLVEQGRARIAIELFPQQRVCNVRKLLRLHLIVDRVPRLGGPRPLRMQTRLRPKLVAGDGDKPFHQELRGVQIALAVDTFHVRGPAAADLIDQVNGIAPSNEILRPPVASIRRTGEIRPAHGTARNHNQWKAMRAVLRNQIFHIGMTRYHLAVRRVEVLASDKEIALLGNSQRSHLLRICRAHERNNGGDGG